MRQIVQDLSKSGPDLIDAPCPRAGAGKVLIATERSLISAGTERMLVDFAKANYLDKARQQPEKVRQALDKVKTDGLLPTLEAVRGKLAQPLPLGYCNVGRVIEVGAGVEGFRVGERVASNGHHAEAVAVPANLCARVPDAVPADAAAFTVLGAIALQGIRLIQPTLGEAVVVTGLGLIGQMAVQLLRAHGCRVLGLDFDPAKLRMAESFGAETVDLSGGADPVAAAQRFSRGRGVDAVLITAATKSNEPMRQAALMSRKRGRIVLVGVVGLELARADFYEKELSFQVSCSYGPGRYDPAYEQKGQDYPVGFVRWTEQRNFEAVLDMMADGRLNVAPLVSHRFPVEEAGRAYELITGAAPSLGVLLDYPRRADDAALRNPTVTLAPSAPAKAGGCALALIGSGNFATAVLAPAFAKAGARLATVAASNAVTGVHVGKANGFAQVTTDADAVFADPAVNAVAVATRHDTHARYALAALAAGKHVFVEKPLALSEADLDALGAAAARPGAAMLMVGFNRRFAPHVVKLKALLDAATTPKSFVMTVNAGAIPAEHWTQDRAVGGGRIVGEGCHFIDLLRFCAGAPIVSARIDAMDGAIKDSATIALTFADGSIGAIHYLANGSKAFPKERLEVFAAGRVLQLDNFRVLRGFGWPGFSSMRLWRQDKGHAACAAAFVAAVGKGGPAPIPLDQVLEVSRVAVQLQAAI